MTKFICDFYIILTVFVKYTLSYSSYLTYNSIIVTITELVELKLFFVTLSLLPHNTSVCVFISFTPKQIPSYTSFHYQIVLSPHSFPLCPSIYMHR